MIVRVCVCIWAKLKTIIDSADNLICLFHTPQHCINSTLLLFAILITSALLVILPFRVQFGFIWLERDDTGSR